MALFSQRNGIRPLEKALQRESIDEELRKRLWSALNLVVWDRWSPPSYIDGISEDAQQVESIVKLTWLDYFKEPIDTIPKFDSDLPSSAYEIIRRRFFGSEWWEVYDLIEFFLKELPQGWKRNLKILVNSFLEQENAAYRIVHEEVVEIVSEHEVSEIEEALAKPSESVKSHFSRALEFLSDRRQPDYRNSVKESVSAVEAICQLRSGNPKAVLSDCMRTIKLKLDIHPAFDQALKKLYGYASDSGGIRHALTEEDADPTFADGKFMLVTCSAFVNYLWMRAVEVGIELER